MRAPDAPAGLRILGITGGVGAGKSTAARLFADALDAPVLDADEIVADLYRDPQVLARIEDALDAPVRGEDGAVDRRALGRRVFGDPRARRRLEEILHPAVRAELRARLQRLQDAGGTRWAVLDVPLLREGGLDALCDAVVHVAVAPEERCRRACRRHGWDEDTWRRREEAQMPEEEKRRRADAILPNDAGPDRLEAHIRALLPELERLAPLPLEERWPPGQAAPHRRPPAE